MSTEEYNVQLKEEVTSMSAIVENNVEQKRDKREVRSFLNAREPSIDRRYRPCPNRQVRLFDGITEEIDDDSSSIATSIDESAVTDEESSKTTEGDNALVYLRLRPVMHPSSAYTIVGNVLRTASISGNNKIEKHYSFSEIFDSTITQRDVYEKCMGQKIQLEENFTVLTYGTSGSGKTFTLLGDDSNPGIIPRSLENIFTLYEANIFHMASLKMVKARAQILDDETVCKEMLLHRKILGACADIQEQHACLQQTIRTEHPFQTIPIKDVSVFIWVSFVEIYNELVYDLLEPVTTTTSTISVPPRKNLKIVGNKGKYFIKGLTSVYVKSSVEALKLLRYGLQRVTYASTAINTNSSRSHCIFFVDVLKYHRSGTITEISYKFCDLAGSERLDKTGNIGSRLKEAQRINTSLMVLGRCLDAANRKRNNEVIPFRESKLTMLLQTALQGKEKLAMLVNVTPTDKYYEENLHVLGFSSIAKNIIFKQPVIKQNNSRYSFLMENSLPCIDADAVRKQYTQMMEETTYLRSELENMKVQHAAELVEQEQKLRNQLVDSFQKILEQKKIDYENRLQLELNSQKRSYEMKLSALKREYENKLEDLREEYEEEQENSVDELPHKRRSLN